MTNARFTRAGTQISSDLGSSYWAILALESSSSSSKSLDKNLFQNNILHLYVQGNLVAADAPMSGLKLSMSGLISAGDMDGTTQVITLPDGQMGLIQATKEGLWLIILLLFIFVG